MDHSSGRFDMNNTHPYEIAFAAQQDVITLCDYGTCPTIKSNKTINTIIVVKSDGSLPSIETRTNHCANIHDEPVANPTPGAMLRCPTTYHHPFRAKPTASY